jgi:hypothetical protein
MINFKAGEKLALVSVSDPGTLNSTPKHSTPVDMSKWHQVVFVLALGDMAAETIDFLVQTCDSDGSNPATLKSAVQLAAHASNNDNKQLLISVRAEELLDSGKTHVRARALTGNTTGGPACMLGFGVDARSEPASDNDLASVVQIVL